MSDELNSEFENLLNICRNIIETDFAPCGLEEKVINRIRELFLEWKRRKSQAELENRSIGGLNVVFYDLRRLVKKARSDSMRFGKPFCEYLEDALSKPYYVKGGLGYYSLSMWQ